MKLRDDLLDALEGKTPVEDLDAKAAQAHLTNVLARHVGGTLALEQAGEDPEQMTLTATIPR